MLLYGVPERTIRELDRRAMSGTEAVLFVVRSDVLVVRLR